MSLQPARPRPTIVPSAPATSAMVFVLPPSTPSRNDAIVLRDQPLGQKVPVRGGHLVVYGLRLRQRQYERVARERADGVPPRSLPSGLCRQHLVLGQHLDEPPHRPRQRLLLVGVDATAITAAGRLDDEI